MIVANFFNIKNTNGLLFYGIDYLKEHPSLVRRILVRPALVEPVRKLMPGFDVRPRSFAGLLREAIAAAARGDLIYTPTPHPLPFLTHQWIVVHDSYPFTARLGTLKRLLLRTCLAMSRCRVAHINESETLPFLRGLGVPNARLLFAPNRMPDPPAFARRATRGPGEPLRVGLVGTESSKKNYAWLFDATLATQHSSHLRFHAYGHRAPYYEGLLKNYPDIDLELFESDSHGLEDFLSSVDVVVSIADQEGFGRPIAVAMAASIPCFLLSKPVFREFFAEAEFFDDVQSLVQALLRAKRAPLSPARHYTPPARVVTAYVQAAGALKTQSSSKA